MGYNDTMPLKSNVTANIRTFIKGESAMIKNHLSRLLGERKWTQADLARRTGVRPNTISALYNEFIDRVSLKQIDRICEVLGCNLSDLLEYIPPKAADHKAK